ncbi:hypothetical protein N7G274_001859 [Stereocaulon virgatum]|uniref:Uncharacterized protein n=1 Tax=Stereocaulon virgatum TaxID=373712 RepID=A0ABR4ANX3_9LECA
MDPTTLMVGTAFDIRSTELQVPLPQVDTCVSMRLTYCIDDDNHPEDKPPVAGGCLDWLYETLTSLFTFDIPSDMPYVVIDEAWPEQSCTYLVECGVNVQVRSKTILPTAGFGQR